MISVGRPLLLPVAAMILGGSALQADPSKSSSAEAAQNSLQQDWADQTVTAALGEDGRVVMTYGEAPAALVCAPLHICAIEFGPDEEFHDTPSLSDPVRWQMEVREGYAATFKRQYLILKPAPSAEKAILTAFTNKRFYSIRLVPDPENYTPVLSFRFPDEEEAAIRARIEADRQAKAAESARLAAAAVAEVEQSGVPTDDGLVAVGELNFDYRIAGDARFAPQRIYDDGKKTYIELPRSWRGEFPVFHAGSGHDRVVNYRIDGRRYEIEGVFEAGSLQLGREIIRIRRE